MRKFHPFAVEAQAKGRKIYHLNIGQPDIATPSVYFDAVRNFADPVLEYAESPGVPSFIHAVQAYYARLGAHYEESEILATTGGSEALSIVMQCILDPGSEVLIPEPYYPNYATFIRAACGHVCPIPTSPEEGYHYAHPPKIEALIHENPRAIMITNPSNPTGVTLTAEERQMLLDVAREYDIYLICDEVYREFFYNGEGLVTMGTLDDPNGNLVIIDSVSKRFSACGARVGCLISKNKALMAEAMKFCQARLSVATLDQVAAAALYTVDQHYFDEMRLEYQRRRDTVMEKLRTIPGVTCRTPDGAFYLMAALPIDDADRFQQWLLTDFEDHGETVMFSPGHSFYATPGNGVNEVRIAYVLKEEDLSRAMDLLALGIKAYQKAIL